MKKYSIIKLEDNLEYTKLIIMCTANSPFDYISMIKEELNREKVNGKILIDQILHVGNTKKRFISLYYKVNEMEKDEFMKFADISKDSLYRKLSCEFLKENELINHSILSSIQKKMINKGINI